MAAQEKPAKVTDILLQLYDELGFRPTQVVVGQAWRWAYNGAPLTVNLPKSVMPVFSVIDGGTHVWINHEDAYFSAAYAAMLIDSAVSIKSGKPKAKQNGETRYVFSAIKKV